jgi:hypothetical protein
LKRRHRVEQLGPVLGHQPGERVGVKAVGVAGHRDGGRAGEGKALKRREIGRFFDQHAVARLQEHHRYEHQGLLRAAGDQQLLGPCVKSADGQTLGDRRAQRGVTLAGRVLQRAACGRVGQDGRERLAQPGGVK